MRLVRQRSAYGKRASDLISQMCSGTLDHVGPVSVVREQEVLAFECPFRFVSPRYVSGLLHQ